MKDIVVMLVAMTYNLVLFGTAVYLIGWKDWSPWWILLPMCLAMSVKVTTP